MNHNWLRLLTVVFLSATMLMGCNNTDGDNDPAPPDTEEPIEDPKDATDPDNTDENKDDDEADLVPDSEDPDDDEADLVPDSEDPIEDPKDATDPDIKDE
ncbi:hypothetical protein [Peribacillus phoenicis]|uniref:hypothetical protein n=1 Tax=Peribacillus sp. 1P06PA-2 TaxID=3132295 RepID=UPI0039A7547B